MKQQKGRKDLQQNNLPIKAILIVDNAPCHPPENDLKNDDGSIFVMYMLPNVTPLIQPMDQNAIRITKLYYRQSLLRVAIEKKDISQFLKSLTLKDAIYLFVLAWDLLKPEVIQKFWRPMLEEGIDESDNEEELIPLSEDVITADSDDVEDDVEEIEVSGKKSISSLEAIKAFDKAI